METLLSLSQASKVGGVSVSTLRRWCNDGRVEAIKDREGNWKIKESSFHSIVESYKVSEKSGRIVQGATAVQNTPMEGVLKDTLERMVEPLRKALEREITRVEGLEDALQDARARVRDLEAKLEARDMRIAQLQDERLADVKQGAPNAAVLQALLEKVSDLEEQAHRAPISRFTDTVGSLFLAKNKR
jgi:uncharacterized coiled-coil protein SlyX